MIINDNTTINTSKIIKKSNRLNGKEIVISSPRGDNQSAHVANQVVIIHQNNSISTNQQSDLLFADSTNSNTNSTLIYSTTSGAMDDMNELKYMKGYVNVLKERFTRNLNDSIIISNSKESNNTNTSTSTSSVQQQQQGFQKKQKQISTSNLGGKLSSLQTIQANISEYQRRRSASPFMPLNNNNNKSIITKDNNYINKNKLFASSDDLRHESSVNVHKLNKATSNSNSYLNENTNNNNNNSSEIVKCTYLNEINKDELPKPNFVSSVKNLFEKQISSVHNTNNNNNNISYFTNSHNHYHSANFLNLTNYSTSNKTAAIVQKQFSLNNNNNNNQIDTIVDRIKQTGTVLYQHLNGSDSNSTPPSTTTSTPSSTSTNTSPSSISNSNLNLHLNLNGEHVSESDSLTVSPRSIKSIKPLSPRQALITPPKKQTALTNTTNTPPSLNSPNYHNNTLLNISNGSIDMDKENKEETDLETNTNNNNNNRVLSFRERKDLLFPGNNKKQQQSTKPDTKRFKSETQSETNLKNSDTILVEPILLSNSIPRSNESESNEDSLALSADQILEQQKLKLKSKSTVKMKTFFGGEEIKDLQELKGKSPVINNAQAVNSNQKISNSVFSSTSSLDYFNFEFIGAGVKLEKSILIYNSNNSKKSRKKYVNFTDIAETYEYPSFEFLLKEMGFDPLKESQEETFSSSFSPSSSSLSQFLPGRNQDEENEEEEELEVETEQNKTTTSTNLFDTNTKFSKLGSFNNFKPSWHNMNYELGTLDPSSLLNRVSTGSSQNLIEASSTDSITTDILPSKEDELKKWSSDMDSNILF